MIPEQTARRQQGVYLGEVTEQAVHADVFDHAHRGDFIETARQIAVIGKLDGGAVLQTRSRMRRAALSNCRRLSVPPRELARKRCAAGGHQRTESAADVQEAFAGLQGSARAGLWYQLSGQKTPEPRQGRGERRAQTAHRPGGPLAQRVEMSPGIWRRSLMWAIAAE